MPRAEPTTPNSTPAAQAKNTPVHAPKPALSTADLLMAQAPYADIDNRSETILPVDGPLEDEHLAALAFAEEPVTIVIEPSDEENAPLVVDCWVNGKGAEVLDPISGKWLEMSCIPIGGPVTTKRKYVEVLARSRTDRVNTTSQTETPQPGADGWKMTRSSKRKSVFSVIDDRNPKGREWLTRLMAER